MNFWDTIRGHQLADTLIRQLPKLTRQKQQEMVESHSDEQTKELIQSYLNNKYNLVSIIPLASSTLLIFEK